MSNRRNPKDIHDAEMTKFGKKWSHDFSSLTLFPRMWPQLLLSCSLGFTSHRGETKRRMISFQIIRTTCDGERVEKQTCSM